MGEQKKSLIGTQIGRKKKLQQHLGVSNVVVAGQCSQEGQQEQVTGFTHEAVFEAILDEVGVRSPEKPQAIPTSGEQEGRSFEEELAYRIRTANNFPSFLPIKFEENVYDAGTGSKEDRWCTVIASLPKPECIGPDITGLIYEGIAFRDLDCVVRALICTHMLDSANLFVPSKARREKSISISEATKHQERSKRLGARPAISKALQDLLMTEPEDWDEMPRSSYDLTQTTNKQCHSYEAIKSIAWTKLVDWQWQERTFEGAQNLLRLLDKLEKRGIESSSSLYCYNCPWEVSLRPQKPYHWLKWNPFKKDDRDEHTHYQSPLGWVAGADRFRLLKFMHEENLSALNRGIQQLTDYFCSRLRPGFGSVAEELDYDVQDVKDFLGDVAESTSTAASSARQALEKIDEKISLVISENKAYLEQTQREVQSAKKALMQDAEALGISQDELSFKT